jgi:zinc protease
MPTYQLHDTTLANGLKVLVVTDPTTPLMAARTYVRAGAITEGDCAGQGISHFLEHLVAGGPTRFRTEGQYQTTLSLLGGGYNAYTTTDHTCYYINTIPEKSKEAITILSEWMFSNTFSTVEFEREREVITREIEKNSAELGRVFYHLCQTHFYQNHPMRYSVIGNLDNFKTTTMAQLKQYYRQFYVPSNMILVVGSPFSADIVMPWIEDLFGKAPAVAPPTTLLTHEPRPFASRTTEKEWNTASTYYSIRFATTDLFSTDLYALDLLDFLLSNGEDSLLHHDIVDTKKLAFSVQSSSYTPHTTTGYFDFTFELEESAIPAAREALFAQLADIKNGNVDASRVLRAKKQKLAEEAFSMTTIEDITSRVGQGALYAQTPQFYDHYLARFRLVTVEDVIRVANAYFDFDRIVETRLHPPRKTSKKSSKSKIIIPEVKIPERHVLPNGVRVLIYPETSYPRVYVKTFFDGGIRRETAATNGIGHALSDLLGTGTSTMSKLDIVRQFEDRGADTGASLGNNSFYYTMECMSEDLPDLFKLYVDTILDARFDPKELKETQRQSLNWISQRRDDWHRYAAYQFRKGFYGDYPYGLPLIGEADVVKSLTVDQIDSFYRTHLDPHSMVVTIFGDINVSDALAMAGQLGHFSGVPNTMVTPPRHHHTAPAHHHLSVDQDVAAVFVGFDGVRLKDEHEAIRLDLVNTVLSGMNYPAGRLHHLLREEGLVYMVHGVNTVGIDPGHFLICALTSDPHQQRVHDIIHAQIESIKTKSIELYEFDQALAQMRFHFKDRVASLDALSTITAIDELFGRGFDHYAKVEVHVNDLTIDDVSDYARRFLINPQEYWFNKGK